MSRYNGTEATVFSHASSSFAPNSATGVSVILQVSTGAWDSLTVIGKPMLCPGTAEDYRQPAKVHVFRPDPHAATELMVLQTSPSELTHSRHRDTRNYWGGAFLSLVAGVVFAVILFLLLTDPGPFPPEEPPGAPGVLDAAPDIVEEY